MVRGGCTAGLVRVREHLRVRVLVQVRAWVRVRPCAGRRAGARGTARPGALSGVHDLYDPSGLSGPHGLSRRGTLRIGGPPVVVPAVQADGPDPTGSGAPGRYVARGRFAGGGQPASHGREFGRRRRNR
ncbi:hypothetical protein BIV25_32375 [Streptomyces sp. MUSC 14]|nr:hypothetical protein BIV25_32375 [Streptomyces sp. MUSC 14]